MLEVDRVSGLLAGANYVPSPNFDARPADIGIDALIIHAIAMPPVRAAVRTSNSCFVTVWISRAIRSTTRSRDSRCLLTS